MGDEAYFQGSENFHFIMVRKGDRIFVMKVNKITSKTSLDEFMLTAKNIANKCNFFSGFILHLSIHFTTLFIYIAVITL